MAALLSGETVSVNKLLPNGRDQSVTDALRDIARRALTNAEEKGLQTLFISLGMATWPASDGGRPTESPILLVPVALKTRSGSQSFTLARAGNVQVNLVLLHVLETQYGVKIEPEEVIQRLQGDDEGEAFNPDPVYQDVLRRASDLVPGFDVKASTMLGNFAFQKMAMVKDLQERKNELAFHDIIAGIAGDSDARVAVGLSQENVDPRELDRIPPDNEFIVLDADSSQQCAITAIVRGQNGVIHGPPGTGKSQTIVNLIASLAANGKRVLFVAEKRAALQVVQRRLKDIGLDHLAIDLHGADVSAQRVMKQVGRALDTVRASTVPDTAAVHEKLVDRRNRLNGHVERLHGKREPAKRSAYELQGLLLRLAPKGENPVRWRGADLAKITIENARATRDLLKEAGGFASLFLRTDPSPWTGATLPTGKDVQNAIDLAARLAGTIWPAFDSAITDLARATGLKQPTTFAEAKTIIELVSATESTLSIYTPDLYRHDLDRLLTELAPGKNGGLSAAWAWCSDSRFREARALVISPRATKVGMPQLYAEVMAAKQQRDKWLQLSASRSSPAKTPSFGATARAFSAASTDLTALRRYVTGRQLEELTLEDLGALIAALASDTDTPHQLPTLYRIEQGLATANVSKLVDKLRKEMPPVDTWEAFFDYAWYASTLDAAAEQDPNIRGFKGSTHSSFVDDFVNLDEERLSFATARVRRAHAERAVAAMNSHPEQQLLIRAEAQKAGKHLPLRKLFAQASEVLLAVCPCWMASPLSVSQLLDGGDKYFDFVVFDEASQVLPEDAVPAILRGSRVVVAGDRNQLPPTTFFAAGDDDEGDGAEANASEGYESLLDMMNSFLPGWYLDWHYRSRDESLISFSNHHIYDDRLVTFPGAGGPPVISHVLVTQQPGRDGEEESCGDEVRKVVELVLEHARTRPKETLGVITMGIKHAKKVEAALDRALEGHPELQEFFDPNLSERFFVKNLERVQGDERDAIILTVGYGKDRGGNLPFRFGPLLSEGGRRRLNVAVTRARQRLTLVSSFSHLDMDLARVRPRTGVELLRDYLQYASSNGKRLGDAAITGVAPNDFEAAVYDALTAEGIRLIPQMGASRFRIDLVAEHPRKPGRYVLAIECDGATYHSSNTARDRDRLRQQQLEHLGWRFHRIWSTDWFNRKDEEIKRTLKAFEEAVRYADRLDSGAGTDNGNHRNANGTNAPLAAAKRGPRPAIPLKTSIGDYTTQELIAMVKWICSDGQLRTDDEIISEVIPVLGFHRRGARIERVIRNILEMRRK